ncbi:MAG TPA: hydroxyisourate hydrolase [Longimicrobiaceae bacterium]|nr:hydroxyisourate hydrolase [Longimicrobiaceae bacterium]
MSAITTHVLDTARGRPAAGVAVFLERVEPATGRSVLARGVTDADGRLRDLLPPDAPLEQGAYRLVFDTGAYFRTQGVEGFYPEVVVVFEVRNAGEHFHVPLLLSPYGYSTYRGS